MTTLEISFEFFPPKTDTGMTNLLQAATTLASINPNFFSVTFGAAGSAQTHTPNTVFKVQEHTSVPTAPHISCVAATKEMIKALLEKYIQNNIMRLVVLRGDMPSDTPEATHHFQYAAELLQFIRQETGNHFTLSVACYPEFHPQTTDHKRALFHFKEKVDAGANNAITNYEKLVLFSKTCGAEIPRWLLYRLESYQHDAKSFEQFSEEVVMQLCEKLIAGGAPGLHFYSLNKAEPSINILTSLKLHQSHPLF